MIVTTCERIDSLLKSHNISRRKLAIEAGISPSSFQSAMERNSGLSFDMLFRISVSWNIPLGSLIGEDMMNDKDTRLLLSAAGIDMLRKYKELGYDFSDLEAVLVGLFNRLNDDGKNKALDTVADLAEIPKYQDKNAPQWFLPKIPWYLASDDDPSPIPSDSEGNDPTPTAPPPESTENGE